MAEAVLYGLAQEILKKTGSIALKEIASSWGFKSDLDKLNKTMNTVKDYLLDAEDKQADNQAVHGWLTRLSDVVYDADDLFDQVATIASKKQLMDEKKFTEEVRTFFSRNNQISYAPSISRKIRAIREELDHIVKEGNGFDLVRRSYVEGRVTRRRDQSYSFVEADDIIGRVADKKAILDLLLSSPSKDDEHEQRVLPVVSIVGMGGLGKTTLAQLVYNDPSVEKFYELRLWVCVSDVFDIKEIIEKILKSATNSETPKLEMDQLQDRLRKEIGNKKYLLVLDDVWNENREEWLKVKGLLKSGREGSKILVTTRFSKVANIIKCTFRPYELRALSEEQSWELFEKVAFAPEQAQHMPHLVNIGKEIVLKCANIPLAIRIIGSVLYGEDESKWQSIKDRSLAKISNEGMDIMNILKYSYYHLGSPLKHCFAYCALFPKDYDFGKEMLISHWMAEGFIVRGDDENGCLEDLGEEYFLTLLQRGFFQDVKLNEWGCIESCKMHDLIHDLAQQVAGAKCKVVTPKESNYQANIRHLSIAYHLNSQNKIPPAMLNLKLPRTLLLPKQYYDSTFSEKICRKIISNFSYLRVLYLHGLGLKNLPASIGNLIHLRYLDISYNPIKTLPNSITKLHNLQLLNLTLSHIENLPAKITKLVNLRSLDVTHCPLSEMPSGIGQLNSLHKLPFFILGEKSPKLTTKRNPAAQLNDLKKLNNLKGKLYIKLDCKFDSMTEAIEEILTNKPGLTELEIDFSYEVNNREHAEVVLEGLKPCLNLRELVIRNYLGEKLPSWLINNNLLDTLPKLVTIQLYHWEYCQEVPNFSQLPHLKRLHLLDLTSVEYMEMGNGENEASSSIKSTLFFPSLETLKISFMKELKGWRKEVDTSSESEIVQQPNLLSLSFPKLLYLDILYCPNLTSFPSCPNVENLWIVTTNRNLQVSKMTTTLSKLKKLRIENADELVSFPKQVLDQLSSLIIADKKLVDTQMLGEVFATMSSSLRSLELFSCKSLKYIHKGLEHLTSLEEFQLVNCNEYDGEEDEEMPWKAFKSSLGTLELKFCNKLSRLPSGLQHLTNLRRLGLFGNGELRELPEWICNFSSLQSLDLRGCKKLVALPEGFRQLTSLQLLVIYDCSPELKKICRETLNIPYIDGLEN